MHLVCPHCHGPIEVVEKAGVHCFIPKKWHADYRRHRRRTCKTRGFTPDELDFIIDYDIKYRMGGSDDDDD